MILKKFPCHLRGVLTFLLFKSRLLWRYSIIPAGVDYYYPEGFTVTVLENESPGRNCYGINRKTNKLSSTSISGNDTECFGARPGWKNMGRKGKRTNGLCIFVWGRNLIGYDFGLFLQPGFLASGRFFLIIYGILYQNMFHPICS